MRPSRVPFAALAALVALLVLLPGLAGAQEATPPAAQAAESAPPAPSDAAPETSALALAVVDDESGVLLYGVNPHERRAQASLTKMTTALVARARWGLDDDIVATKNDMTIPSIIGMDPGDHLALHDILFGLLLNSGNDAALAIAETVGDGSIPRFVGWMNDSVPLMGLHDTHYANPVGFDDPEHYSSAYDVAQIGRVLLRDDFLAGVVSSTRHVVPGPPRWVFTNLHPLVGKVPGVDGLKTGYETNAGHCLATSMVRDGHRLIVVVLHDDNSAQDTLALFDWAFSRYTWRTVRLPDPDTGRAVTRTVAVPADQLSHLRGMVRFEWESRR